ncbi:MAG TPA: CPBP family intramembrane glutamic endopeptidase [Polyangiaceae bacterium]|nr:CPBP family intramembrane glutamic endopeptidase [Polyangiaceae bacterium]
MLRWGRVAVAYLAASASAVVVALLWRGTSPFNYYGEPWLVLPSALAHVYSLVIGLALGAAVAFSTRIFVSRYAWARNLHSELRPVARDLSAAGIIAVAAFSALGEELWFRGLLEPWIGLWLQAALFGIVHAQLRGPSRWAWISWATVMGLAFGATFQLTGSLAGPIAAHALINSLNLSYLKSHDPEPRRRPLGGLLSQRS